MLTTFLSFKVTAQEYLLKISITYNQHLILWSDHKIFSCVPASAGEADAINPYGIKTLLANGLMTLFINGEPVFSNEPKSPPKNPPNCIMLDN